MFKSNLFQICSFFEKRRFHFYFLTHETWTQSIFHHGNLKAPLQRHLKSCEIASLTKALGDDGGLHSPLAKARYFLQ